MHDVRMEDPRPVLPCWSRVENPLAHTDPEDADSDDHAALVVEPVREADTYSCSRAREAVAAGPGGVS